MGSRLALSLLGIILLVSTPVGGVFAQRAQQQAPPSKAKITRAITPTPVRPVVATTPLLLSGTYVLASVNGRRVRDIELAKSNVSFLARGEISVTTACHGFGAVLQSKSSPNHILGFSRILSPAIACADNRSNQAHASTMRLFAQTANVARAGNTVTFFNAVGINIAQWTALANAPPPPGNVAPQPRAQTPRQGRVFSDDSSRGLYGPVWVLKRLNNTAISTINPPTITFEDNQASGSTGCNSFTIKHSHENGRSRFTRGIATEMACGPQRPDNLEKRFMQALESTTIIDISPANLILRSADNTSVMVFGAN